MKKETFILYEKQCAAYYQDKPDILLVQPVDEHDLAGLDHQTDLISSSLRASIFLIAIKIEDWNKELSPWQAPAVFGPEPFGAGAPETLEFIQYRLLPHVFSEYLQSAEIPVILGGYSLAGFFSLWSSYQTNIFSAAAAVSPSVWFPGWMEFAQSHKSQAEHVYLSLGDREEKTKNRVMSAVGDCIRSQQKLLAAQGTDNTLEWNKGNHFMEPDIRCAKGFIWCANSVIKDADKFR